MASCQACSTAGLRASPAATIPRRSGSGAEGGALGDHAVLGGGHAEHVHALTRQQLQALGVVEAGVVQQRSGAGEPGGDEDVARGLRPSGGGGAPHQLPRARPEPVGGLEALAEEVALAVEDRLGLAGGAAGERDQAGLLGAELRRRSGGPVEEGVVRNEHDLDPPVLCGPVVEGRLQLGAVALVGDHQPRPGDREAQAQVLGAQLLGAGQHDGAEAKAGEHREHPLGAVADQGHHHVPAPAPRGGRARRPGGRCARRPRRSSTRGASRRG